VWYNYFFITKSSTKINQLVDQLISRTVSRTKCESIWYLSIFWIIFKPLRTNSSDDVFCIWSVKYICIYTWYNQCTSKKECKYIIRFLICLVESISTTMKTHTITKDTKKQNSHSFDQRFFFYYFNDNGNTSWKHTSYSAKKKQHACLFFSFTIL